MLTPIQELFEEVIQAYVSAESDNLSTNDYYTDQDYRYEMSRILSMTEEWRAKLERLLNDKG